MRKNNAHEFTKLLTILLRSHNCCIFWYANRTELPRAIFKMLEIIVYICKWDTFGKSNVRKLRLVSNRDDVVNFYCFVASLATKITCIKACSAEIDEIRVEQSKGRSLGWWTFPSKLLPPCKKRKRKNFGYVSKFQESFSKVNKSIDVNK